MRQTQSGPPEDCGGEGDSGGEGGRKLVAAGCDASPILQAAEHALDEVALAVGDLVERVTVLPGRLFGMTGIAPRSSRKCVGPSLS
jgi:hypothetical protein